MFIYLILLYNKSDLFNFRMKRGKRQITNTVNIFGLEGEQTSNPFLDLGNKS